MIKRKIGFAWILFAAIAMGAWGCSELVYIYVMHQNTRTVESPYFSRGFDEDIDPLNISTFIADSCNISERSIRLDRMDNDTLKSYWVDLDTNYSFGDLPDTISRIRLRIVDKSGVIISYYYCSVQPYITGEIRLDSIYLGEDTRGNIVIVSPQGDHRLYHATDKMILHYFDIDKPALSHGNASFQSPWNGYGFNESWVTYEGKREDYHFLKIYSYKGKLRDSMYVTIHPNDVRIQDNHFINYDFDYPENNHIINKGLYHRFEIEEEPFGGFGEDRNAACLNPLLHSFTPNGYIRNCFAMIRHGKPVPAFDWFRNELNIKMAHATIQSIGYSKFLSKEEFTGKKYSIRGDRFSVYNGNYSLSDVNDSLIYYYRKDTAPVFYREFWERRKSENIAQVVYGMLVDIQNHYLGKPDSPESNYVNDTLKRLMRKDLNIQHISAENKKMALLNYFEYLKQIDLNQSAYNLVFIDTISSNLDFDRNRIFKDFGIGKKKYLFDNKVYFLTRNKPKWIEGGHGKR